MIIEFDGKKPQIASGTFIAPTATIIGDVIVEEGASIWFGAVLRGDFGRIIVRKGSSVQDNAVVHVIPDCETVIGENVTVAHGVVLHGCKIEKGAIVGMGSVLQDFCVIGEQAMVAAGSVVPSNMQIPPRHLAAGIPAKVKKEIEGASLLWVSQSALMYQELAGRYMKQGLGYKI
ncbi:MAG TPA: gamma carbonic anhydrase family protein [Candidatus Limnocylindrales bacterium]|nr:gamma carbonic anhydrase family protein [Candidatus Limnocylindrales bacterium]